MTISELIKSLQQIQVSAGDVEVLVWREIAAYSIETVKFTKDISSEEQGIPGCVVIDS